MTECRLCDADAIALDESGLARVIAFPAPQFEPHLVVMTTRHCTRLEEVSPDEWRAVGTLVTRFTERLCAETGAERLYLLAIGDADEHKLHMHLVPRQADDPPLGPHIFGPDGWNAGRLAKTKDG